MPNALAFDTLAYAKKMKAAGFTELQAEVQAEALIEIVEGWLATRQNLKELEVALRLDIEGVRRDIKEMEVALRHDIERVRHDMKEMEQRITIRLGGLIATSIIIIAAMIKLL